MNLVRNIRRDKFSQWDKDSFTFMCKADYKTFVEFVGIHYALSHRTDTKYWLNNFNKQWDKGLIDIEPRYLGNYRVLIESKKFDYYFNTDTGYHCIAAGMNYSPTELDSVLYDIKDDWLTLKFAWLNSIKILNRKKEKAELAVYSEPSLYKYLKNNIYNG